MIRFIATYSLELLPNSKPNSVKLGPPPFVLESEKWSRLTGKFLSPDPLILDTYLHHKQN